MISDYKTILKEYIEKEIFPVITEIVGESNLIVEFGDYAVEDKTFSFIKTETSNLSLFRIKNNDTCIYKTPIFLWAAVARELKCGGDFDLEKIKTETEMFMIENIKSIIAKLEPFVFYTGGEL